MTAQTTTTVSLNPCTEFGVIQQYEQDKGWYKVSETTAAYVFEMKTPLCNMDAVYLPSGKETE